MDGDPNGDNNVSSSDDSPPPAPSQMDLLPIDADGLPQVRSTIFFIPDDASNAAQAGSPAPDELNSSDSSDSIEVLEGSPSSYFTENMSAVISPPPEKISPIKDNARGPNESAMDTDTSPLTDSDVEVLGETSPKPPPKNIVELPQIIIEKIASKLPVRDRLALRKTCTTFQQMLFSSGDGITFTSLEEMLSYKNQHRIINVCLCQLAENVGKKWNWTGQGELVWKVILMTCAGDIMTEKKKTVIMRMANHFPNLTSIHFQYFRSGASPCTKDLVANKIAPDDWLQAVGKIKEVRTSWLQEIYDVLVSFAHVTHLGIYEWAGCKKEEACYAQIRDNMKNLVGLDIKLSEVGREMLKDSDRLIYLRVARFAAECCILSIIKSLVRVQVLEVEVQAPMDHEEVLLQLSRCTPNLRNLRISCIQRKNKDLSVFIEPLNTMTPLVQLCLTDIKDSRRLHMVGVYREVYKLRLPLLEDLYVEFDLTRDQIVRLFRNCPRLTNLYLVIAGTILGCNGGRDLKLEYEVNRSPLYVWSAHTKDPQTDLFPERKKMLMWVPNGIGL